jgi:transcriptional regulator with XRE-family HTH domain
LLQKDVALKIGVTDCTITNWENSNTSPPVEFIPKIVEFIGYVPPCLIPKADATIGERIRASRRLLGLNQERFAEKVGFSEDAIRDWEAGRYKPSKKSVEKLKDFLTGKHNNKTKG